MENGIIFFNNGVLSGGGFNRTRCDDTAEGLFKGVIGKCNGTIKV